MNPWEGVTADWSILGVEFTQAWQRLAGVIWIICMIIVSVILIRNLVAIAQATAETHPAALKESRKSAVTTGWIAGALVGFPVIIAIVTFVAGKVSGTI